jgi:predicted porin
MNSTKDLFSSATLVPFVKDAYLSFSLGGGTSLVAGIQGPPSFGNEEDIWGYRSLEKTPLDLYKWTSSRDFGISVKGGEGFLYHFMFGQGSSNKSETNNGKKFFGSLGYESGGLFVEAVAQYERAKTGDDDLILKGFGAYSGDWGRIGVMYAYRDYKNEGAASSLAYNIFSIFAVIKAGEKVELIGRYDMNFGDGYKTSFKGTKVAYVPFANNHEFSFAIAAVSFNVHKNVWLIPNIKLTMYKDPDIGIKADNDFYGNLTLWFKF